MEGPDSRPSGSRSTNDCRPAGSSSSSSTKKPPPLPDPKAQDVMRRVLAAHAAHALPVNTLYAEVPADPLPDNERLQRQRAAIADIVKRSGLAGSDKTVVEFGAGDGSLSRTLCREGVAGSFVLIDRSKQRMNRAAMSQMPMSQLCTDVASLRPEELREAAPNACIMVSNHLCGAAQDAAIQCALNAWVDAPTTTPCGGPCGECSDETGGGKGGRGSSDSLAGIVAVTCCHHACADASFLGTAYLRDVCGLSTSDRELVRKWSLMAPRRERAANCRPRVIEASKVLEVSPSEAAHLGLCCRALMDSARARFLHDRGFSVSLVHHVPNTLTADNVMLLAVRTPPLQAATPIAAGEGNRVPPFNVG